MDPRLAVPFAYRCRDTGLTVLRGGKLLQLLAICIFFAISRISLLTFLRISPYKPLIDDGGGAGADGLDG
ncbi:hypothetical protein [Aureimonas phyllosphaerae]|uniref:Uncharacterized protein n=1 Tax=Aureimonas phyllosphaerae TaxID=1166078 RepID=A0A7W6C262_9HYPH|nr:hypothetical protein [Aureimonas phyllosphaerae]MBB3937107.1 hypothetical protein [Aureimonas phyllosphaerae]MBB3961256.1 hypothetical protein [Aureimonas phyllosphaerae]